MFLHEFLFLFSEPGKSHWKLIFLSNDQSPFNYFVNVLDVYYAFISNQCRRLAQGRFTVLRIFYMLSAQVLMYIGNLFSGASSRKSWEARSFAAFALANSGRNRLSEVISTSDEIWTKHPSLPLDILCLELKYLHMYPGGTNDATLQGLALLMISSAWDYSGSDYYRMQAKCRNRNRIIPSYGRIDSHLLPASKNF